MTDKILIFNNQIKESFNNPEIHSFTERLAFAVAIFKHSDINLSYEYWTCIEHDENLDIRGRCSKCNEIKFITDRKKNVGGRPVSVLPFKPLI